MEADTVAELAFDAGNCGPDAAEAISDWFDYDRSSIPSGAVRIDHNTYVAEVTAVGILSFTFQLCWEV